jgi:hypothetical protein
LGKKDDYKSFPALLESTDELALNLTFELPRLVDLADITSFMLRYSLPASALYLEEQKPKKPSEGVPFVRWLDSAGHYEPPWGRIVHRTFALRHPSARFQPFESVSHCVLI